MMLFLPQIRKEGVYKSRGYSELAIALAFSAKRCGNDPSLKCIIHAPPVRNRTEHPDSERVGIAHRSRGAGARKKMSNEETPGIAPSSRVEKRRAETDRVFAEMQQKERAERLAKTTRLRKLRLLNDEDAAPERSSS